MVEVPDASSTELPPMAFTVHRHPDSDAFLRRAEHWLLREEAEHNLILGVAARGRDGGLPPDSFFATIEGADDVAGCALRTPPLKLLLTRMPPEAMEPLADAVGEACGVLPAVLGPEEEATGFARVWTRRTGSRSEPGMRQRIYRLDAVVPPARIPPGRLRRAGERDLELVAAWMEAFAVDTRTERTESASVRRWVDAGDLFLWDDGEPRCMAAIVRRTPNGAAVAAVYTPPALRGRGYASACVAGVSQEALDAGARFCFLYTDLANPTSNSIYSRIGYRPVCNALDVVFDIAVERLSSRR
jgi:uncharacterized protein